jgi:iron only hydrogenase large subunit-like protein
MIATAMVVKELYGENVAAVFIGPCIDNKDETFLYREGKLVDGVLTFIELRQMFEESGIQERTVKMSEFDPPYGNWGALYPLPAGLVQAGGIKATFLQAM